MLIILVIAVVVIAAVALAVLKAKSGAAGGAPQPEVYYLKNSLFSPAERSFAGVLESLDYENLTIASKVRLADIFGIKKGLAHGDRLRAFNRINAKHVDFLLIQSSDGRPLLGVELDDSSHNEKARVERDAFVDSVFTAAGLPILHIAAKAAYDPKDIRRQIESALARNT
ncbi:MAG: DUF2726 domain-containing protein [Verrucomicrobiota bacterium]